VSTLFFVHEAQGAADTTGVAPDEKSESAAPGTAMARTATAATEAAEAAEAERTSLRRSAFVCNWGNLSEDTSMESWNTLARSAISRVHDLHGAQPSR
jgi:hypothetical protein